MNLNNIEIKNIERVIAHEIYPKTKTEDAYATTLENLLVYKDSEKKILANRLLNALSNSKKTFQLEYEDMNKDSIYSYLSTNFSCDDETFIDYSKKLADELADAHFRIKIPGGFCIIGQGVTTTDKHFFFIIKAELQEVFNIQGNELKLIENVFLSPAKDFYKIGFFIENGSGFTPFMYDDLFSLQKKDLTEYFYGKFLGLTTDRNDELKSKNYFEDTKKFIETNVNNVKDRIGFLKALHVLYREETSGLISPKEFSENYFEGKLKVKYEKLISEKYPHSFTKRTQLIDNRLELERISIPLSYTLAIVGKSSDFETIEVIDEPNMDSVSLLQPEIDTGSIKKIVVLKQVRDTVEEK